MTIKNIFLLFLLTITSAWSELSYSQSQCANLFSLSSVKLSSDKLDSEKIELSVFEKLLDKFPTLKGMEAEVKPLKTGLEGLAAKIALIDRATQTIDVSYYILKPDASGLSILNALKKAMDRGVKIRVLVDGAGSFNLRSAEMVVLMAYNKQFKESRIEIKIVNPLFSFQNFMSKLQNLFTKGEWNFDMTAINNRMHDKILLVDAGTENSVAVVGGRNLSNSDFGILDAKEGFDYEVIIKGGTLKYETDPLKVIEEHFEMVFNHKLNLLLTDRIWGIFKVNQDKYLQKLESASDTILSQKAIEEAIAQAKKEDFWSQGFDSAKFIFVNEVQNIIQSVRKKFNLKGWLFFGKGGAKGKVSLSQSFFEGAMKAKKKVVVVSPYVLFSPTEINWIKQWLLDNPSAEFVIYSNSLSSTNKFLVYGLFRYVNLPQLLEIQADSRIGDRLKVFLYMDKRLMHMKAVLLDNETSFVTTSNLDPRSRLYNSEIGFWVESIKNYSAITEKIQDIENLSQPIKSTNDADNLVTGSSAPFKKVLMRFISRLLEATDLEQLF